LGETIKELEKYVALARAIRANEFAQKHPYPFLVRITADAQIEENPWEDQFAFSTDISDAPDEDDDDGEDLSPRAAIVAPVRKREGGLFPDRITVGRARNCDVVLRFPSVSKLHARLIMDGSQWVLVDHGSANGTFVNGTAVSPRARTALKLGDRLRLGEIEVDFVDAKTAYERLRTITD
jgi:pSer/pThr/pTyr-binding forkhead associated (FHA) protein